MRRGGGPTSMTLSDSVYERLLQQRIIVLGQQVDDDIANRIAAQMLLLSAEDPQADIALYINSPGGSVTAGMAIFDTMEFIECDVATYAMGLAASMGQFLLSAGTPGKRFALPNSRILIHQPATEGIYGQVSDLEIQAAEISRMRKLLEATLAKHSGRTPEQVRQDIERDKILTAPEAKEYGIIDEIIQSRELAPVG
ncbi:MAG TPA: ATP-dependent Clp protease proteolytic subunit [Pseudonocardia sp.]|nr:ATP-dependent Clp protease proteolytic subunit [Pseudonocardia sp.]